MAMKFFEEKLVSTIGKIEGPSVSISPRRSQVVFSNEAATMMELKMGKSFIEIGYDDKAGQVAFKVSATAGDAKAKVEAFHVHAKKIDVPAIYIASYLEKMTKIPSGTACRYPLHRSDEGYFFINLSEGKQKPKPVKRPKQKPE